MFYTFFNHACDIQLRFLVCLIGPVLKSKRCLDKKFICSLHAIH
jgi:hypothetical protein